MHKAELVFFLWLGTLYLKLFFPMKVTVLESLQYFISL